jgi:hypothetical protein
MTKKELLLLLESVPDDAEIVTHGYQDDILGEYQYNDDMSVHEEVAHKLDRGGALHMSICNYGYLPHTKVKVWVLS